MSGLRGTFDRYVVWSIGTYRAAGITLPAIALTMILLFLPKVWGAELPTPVVIGVPMTLFAAALFYGMKIEKRVRRRTRRKPR